MMDLSYSKDEVAISFPHEFLPFPEVGEKVKAVNRGGRVVATGKVIKVRNHRSQDRTPIVTIAVPKKNAWVVRGIQRKAAG
jgi:hypothetical protein